MSFYHGIGEKGNENEGGVQMWTIAWVDGSDSLALPTSIKRREPLLQLNHQLYLRCLFQSQSLPFSLSHLFNLNPQTPLLFLMQTNPPKTSPHLPPRTSLSIQKHPRRICLCLRCLWCRWIYTYTWRSTWPWMWCLYMQIVLLGHLWHTFDSWRYIR